MSTFYKVQTGFQIVDSNGVPGTPIDGISSELTESVSKLPTDKAVYDAIEAAKQECKSVLASSEEVEVTGVGTEESPYTLDLTGKVHSSTGVDLQSEEGSDITMFSSLDIGATANRNISMEAGYNINMKAPNMLMEEALFEIYTSAPYEYNYVSNKWAVAQSHDADARNIQFDGSLGEYVYRKTVTSTGPITETATGPLSIVSSGATAEFKGAGPTTVESTGGAPVTVKSNGDSSNYSSLVVTPNAGTLSVNASTANHTLTMFSKSVVEGTTNITELNLNDSTGASLHSSSAPIRVTSDNAPIYLSSPAGAPIQIVSQTIGGQYGYSLVQTQGTSVNLKGYYTETANSELNLGAYNAKLIQNGDANSYVEIQSRNNTANPAVYSDLKLTPTSATLSSYDSVFLTNSEYGSSIGVNSSGKIVGNGYSGVELVAEDDEHVILKANGEDNDGNIITSKLDLYANGDSYLTSPNGVIVETTEAPTHAIFRNVSDDGQGGTLTVGLDVYQGGATLSSNAGPITISSEQAPISVLSTQGAPISLRSALMQDGSTYSANIQLTGSVNISSPGGTIGISSIGPTTLSSSQSTITMQGYSGVSASLTNTTTPTSFLLSGSGATSSASMSAKNIMLLAAKVPDDTGTPSFSAGSVNGTTTISGDSINLVGVSTVRLGPSGSSPISLVMAGDSSSGVSSATLNAKNITLTASQLPSDTTGTSSISISNPPYGTISMSPTGLSFIYPTLPIFVNTNDLRLPAYAKAYDTTDTHKLMTRADTTGSVELATFAELTNEQFGLDENTEAGTMFWVNMTGASADTPEVETLAPGSVGQVLTIGSDGLPEWANGGGGGMVNPMTSYGDIIVGGASGEPEALASGTEGQVLTVGSSGLEWTTPTVGTDWYCGSFTSANRPANPTEGQYGYDTTIDCVIYYIGGYWKNSAGAIV